MVVGIQVVKVRQAAFGSEPLERKAENKATADSRVASSITAHFLLISVSHIN